MIWATQYFSIAEQNNHASTENSQQLSSISAEGPQQLSRPHEGNELLPDDCSNRQHVFKRLSSIFESDNSINVETEQGSTFSEEHHESTIEELRTKLAESVAMVACLKSEVKHVRYYYVNRIPKIETENEILRQENEAITFENDELANDLYDMIQENEEMLVNLDRVERDLLNSKVLVRNVSEENESLLREVEELRVSINPDNSITSWFSIGTKSNDDILSPEDQEDAKMNAEIVQFQLKKNLNHCLLEMEQMRQENVTLNEERDSWEAQFGAISKEVQKIMRIQSGNKRSMTNGPQFKKFSSFDDGNVRIDAHRRISETLSSSGHRRISEILSSSGTMRVKGRLAKQLSRKTSNLLDTSVHSMEKINESLLQI
mmetsp:Transcript_18624/g.21424  ORF Transcript_18624/g.21424 Transcript_18624/m.21424 type:complete len:374 (+) Transcript_18624:46-1167(+)